MSKFKLIFDDKACFGCRACEVACKQEYNPFDYSAYDPKNPLSIKYLSVKENGPKIVDDKLDFMYRVNVCKHCDDAPCISACPEGAIILDKDTGIIVHDKEKCNGCNSVPGRSATEKQETSPCKYNCPAGNNVQGYVNLAAKGKFREAIQLIKETSPFPSVCGRVCYNPCESECNRMQIDSPVSIRSIERFIADKDMESGNRYTPTIKADNKEKAAVIGSGPAGLSCAYYLAREGYKVTIFEKEHIPGGMLTQGIPTYRLPREIVDAEIKVIRDMGVEIKTGIEIGKDKTISGLRSEGFKAFFVGIGTQKCLKMNVKGEDLQGVYGGLDYLRKINTGESVPLGKNVAVIGGGNTAIDAVRTAIRNGASNAFILYRRSMEEMPARPEEIEECLEEGIKINILTQPVRFIGEGGKVKAVECVKMRLGEPEKSGRRKPEPVRGSEFSINVDSVITALGQEAEWTCLTPDCACKLTEWGTININPFTMQSADPDIFAGGDAVRGPRTVIEAIADGREAAISIDRYIRGESLSRDRDKQLTMIKDPMRGNFDTAARQDMPRLDSKERINSFSEVCNGFTEEMVKKEANRCISCGSSCIQACPYDAIAYDVNAGKTQKCNLCIDRVKNGLVPACADNVCLAHCVYFGDSVNIEQMVKNKFWLKYRMEGKLGSLVIKVGD